MAADPAIEVVTERMQPIHVIEHVTLDDGHFARAFKRGRLEVLLLIRLAVDRDHNVLGVDLFVNRPWPIPLVLDECQVDRRG